MRFAGSDFGSCRAWPQADEQVEVRWSVKQNVACVACRYVFEAEATSCPSCNATTFVYLNPNEDPNALCEELLLMAAFARIDRQAQRAKALPINHKARVRQQPMAQVTTRELSSR
jgi:hypothetical protein